MEFLSVHNIRKLAYRKGFSCECTGRLNGRSFVRLYDPRRRRVEPETYSEGFSLAGAKRILVEFPDLAPRARGRHVSG